MAKNTRWSVEDFKKKNLVANKDGVFVNVSSLVQKGKVPKIDPNYAFMKPSHVTELPNVKYPMTIDECCTMQSQDTAITMEVMKDCAAFGTAITRTESDLFGNITTTVISAPVTQLDPIRGEYILWVRNIAGKARDNAIIDLKQVTEEMFKNACADCFYISTNVASSKNSKDIGFYYKKDPITKALTKVPTLMDSKVTKAYRKETDGQWIENKVAFKNAVQGLKLPYNIEFTFIRDSLRKFDKINAAQILCDLMVEYGWIIDDESCYLNPTFGNVYYHKQLSGVLIKIIK